MWFRQTASRASRTGKQVGSLTVHKVDFENRPLSGVTFLLEYSEDGENWNPVVFREEHSTIVPGGRTSQGLKDGALTTGRMEWQYFPAWRLP